ncbi:hypothetical protein AcW1_002925 [Taiwanofungus camphoratus]|nr:hypothetical protein AcV5_001886 [Antrodia cinnamomea]KAI0925405.1 hypothetical protein AcV7_005660 [Antrodia cinnamomea]KAI0942246.1 hypothetical protein AcW1_002925 [Antrodia cinnamomea]
MSPSTIIPPSRLAAGPRRSYSSLGALRSGHTAYNNFPFSYKNKKTFGVKYVIFCGTGFALPWIAVWWQLHKSGGAA